MADVARAGGGVSGVDDLVVALLAIAPPKPRHRACVVKVGPKRGKKKGRR